MFGSPRTSLDVRLLPDAELHQGLENWRDGLGWQTWRCELSRALTDAERHALHERTQAARAERDRDTAARQAAARATAARLWAAAAPAPADHPYLARKAVQPFGLRVSRGVLLVPVRDLAGELHSLQFISGDGAKRFLRGGRVQGLGCWVGPSPEPDDPQSPILIAEGFATAASLREATDQPVAVAFNAGNLEPLARAVRDRWRSTPIIVCADDDHHTAGNPDSPMPAPPRGPSPAGWPYPISATPARRTPPTSTICTGFAGCPQC